MLKKQHRLAKTKDINLAFARGRGFFNTLITIKYLSKNSGESRFTVVVSTKVSKRAVRRNRLKRILREFIRLNLSSFKLGDYAILLRPKAAAVEEKNLLESFKQLLKNSKLFKEI